MEKELENIQQFFQYREEKFMEEIETDMSRLGNRINKNRQEEMIELLESLPKEAGTLKKQIKESLENLVADYNIAMAYYNKKYYTQGFMDAGQVVKLKRD